MSLPVTTVFRTRKCSSEKASNKSKVASKWQTLCSPAPKPVSRGLHPEPPPFPMHVLGWDVHLQKECMERLSQAQKLDLVCLTLRHSLRLQEA